MAAAADSSEAAADNLAVAVDLPVVAHSSSTHNKFKLHETLDFFCSPGFSNVIQTLEIDSAKKLDGAGALRGLDCSIPRLMATPVRRGVGPGSLPCLGHRGPPSTTFAAHVKRGRTFVITTPKSRPYTYTEYV